MCPEKTFYHKEIVQEANYEINGGFYLSFDQAWGTYFLDMEWLRELEKVHRGTIARQSLELHKLAHRRIGLLPYHQVQEEALRIATGRRDISEIRHLVSVYPCNANPFSSFFRDAFGLYDDEARFQDVLRSQGLEAYSLPLSRLVWSGRQRLYACHFTDGDHERHFFESDVQFSSYGVSGGRIEVYDPYVNPRGEIDLRVLYFPYNPYSESGGVQERNGVILERVRNESYITTKVTAQARAGFDGGETEDREVLFCAVTGHDGRTLVLNGLYPEFVWIEKDGGVPSVNGVDRPVLYLPKDWSANSESLRKLGEAFADIDMWYEAYKEGTRAFEGYWRNQSVHARFATSEWGFRSLAFACGSGALATIASEEDMTRHVFGGITLALGACLVAGLRRYGNGYRNLIEERQARGNAFECAVSSLIVERA